MALSKILELLIKNRLEWLLKKESKDLLAENMFEFLKGLSTMDSFAIFTKTLDSVSLSVSRRFHGRLFSVRQLTSSPI